MRARSPSSGVEVFDEAIIPSGSRYAGEDRARVRCCLLGMSLNLSGEQFL